MTMPTFATLGRVSSASLKLVTDQINSLTAPGWTSYTPTWTGSGGNPTVGNSTLNFRYRRAADSDLVIVAFSIFIGSTFVQGTGTYQWTLPFTGSANWAAFLGSMYIFDSGTAARFGATVKLDSTTVMSGGLGTSAVGAGSPQVWAVNDEIKGTILYEPA